MRAARIVSLAAALAGLTIVTSAQAPQFSSRVELVRVDVLATRDRQPVRGLVAADFEVRDNGVVQAVNYFGGDELPLNVVLALDTSRSVTGEPLQHLRAAGHAVFDAMKPADRGGLVLFGLAVVPSRELTDDISSLRAMLDRRAAAGNTSVVDAAFAGLVLGTSDTGRSLMLIFSDGSDTASWLTAASVVDAARRSDVVVNAIVTRSQPGGSFLNELTSVTGGGVMTVKSTNNLNEVFVRLLDEYRARYVIGYTPRGVSRGGWHKIEVKVKRPGVNVTARPGYQAGSS